MADSESTTPTPAKPDLAGIFSKPKSDITDAARLVRTKSCQLADVLAMIGACIDEDSNAIHRLPGALGAVQFLADGLADASIAMAHLVGLPSIDEEGLE